MEKRCVQAPAAVPSVRMLALAGALAALSCAATLTVAVPTPTGGYVNPGDAVVLLGAYVLGAAGALLREPWGLPWQTCWAATGSTPRPHWSSRASWPWRRGSSTAGPGEDLGSGGVRRGGGVHHGGRLLAL